MIRYATLVSLMILTACEHASGPPSQYYDLSDEQIPILQNEALHSNGKSAWLLGKYYLYTKKDNNNCIYWMKVSAEDGYSPGMYEYAFQLRDSKNPEEIKIAKYWFQKAKDAGEPYAAFELEQLK
jgi:TPR repeat protein